VPKKLRLLHVVVQPYFVIDDGENLEPHICEPVTVTASDWPTFPTTGFAAALDQLQTQINAADADAAVPAPS
jgi:hypothetical protein